MRVEERVCSNRLYPYEYELLDPAGALYGGAQFFEAHISELPNFVQVKVTRATFVV
jgi:hypothetical protein